MLCLAVLLRYRSVTDKRTHTDRHITTAYTAVPHGKKIYTAVVVVASQSFFEVCLLPFSSRPNWSAVVDCGQLIISNLPWSILLSFVLCRRFGYIPLILSPFGAVAVLVSQFWLSPFWFVVVLTRHLCWHKFHLVIYRKSTVVVGCTCKFMPINAPKYASTLGSTIYPI